MKALSIRQPRAAQTADGARTLDVRTWATDYRGPVALHAGAKRRVRRIRQLGFVPEALTYGGRHRYGHALRCRPARRRRLGRHARPAPP